MSQQLLDEVVHHQINLAHYSNSVVRRIIALLNRVDSDLFSQLTAALDTLPPESYTVERLETMLASVRRLNADAYAQAELLLTDEVRQLSGAEVTWNESLYSAANPSVSFASVTAEQAYVGAMSRPFQGRLLKEWAASIEAGKMLRIRDAVRMGYVEGATTSQIVQRIRGTRAKGYADGIIEIDRRHAETIVRTALSHTAAVARDRFIEANEDLITKRLWVATLDGKTSFPCRLRDHKQYSAKTHKPIGHSLPWGAGPGKFHFNCRSADVGLLRGQEKLFGTRASVQYRDGERPKGAQVDASESYGDWLRRQPADVQDDVLGTTKGRLFRAGKMKIEQFANDKGRELTIEELKAKYPSAFKRAAI